MSNSEEGKCQNDYDTTTPDAEVLTRFFSLCFVWCSWKLCITKNHDFFLPTEISTACEWNSDRCRTYSLLLQAKDSPQGRRFALWWSVCATGRRVVGCADVESWKYKLFLTLSIWWIPKCSPLALLCVGLSLAYFVCLFMCSVALSWNRL